MLRHLRHVGRRSLLLYLSVSALILTIWSFRRTDYKILDSNGYSVCSRFLEEEPRDCREAKTTKWSGLDFHRGKNYTMQPDCDQYKNMDVVVLIMSSTQEFGLRMAIRQSYIQQKHWNGLKVRHVFIVGLAAQNSEDLQEYLTKESLQDRDILQVQVKEGLYSGSRLMIGTMYWLQSCACKAEYVIKIGRNVVPNIFLMQETMTNMRKTEAEIHCLPITEAVERDNRKQNYIRRDEYTIDQFPEYCESNTFIIRTDSAIHILRTAEERDIFKLEGPYITGLLRKSSCISLQAPADGVTSKHIWSRRIPLNFDWHKFFFIHLHDKNLVNQLTFWEDMLRKMTGNKEKMVYIGPEGG